MERFARLGITERPERFYVWGGWTGDDPPSCESAIIVDFVKRSDPKPLVIVDSFISFHEGSENDADRVRAHMQRYRQLANLGATVMILHHPGKSDTAQLYRGSSDIPGAVDIAFKLENLNSGGPLSELTLRAFKQRVLVNSPLHIRYCDGTFALRDKPNSADARKEHLTTLLKRHHAGVKREEFITEAGRYGYKREQVRDFIAKGIEASEIFEKGKARSTRIFAATCEVPPDTMPFEPGGDF